MTSPLVTIVTPSFNQGEFISDTIESVLSQDYPAIEYTILDGGSTDSTLDVLRGYGDRIHWTSGPDAGQSDAIHRGFVAGTGKYLAWMNSDDRYMPGAIAAAVAELETNPEAALVYGQGEFIERDGTSMGPCLHVEPWNYDRLIREVNFLFQPATLFRRDAYMAVGGLDIGLNYVMDYDLWIRLGRKYQVRFLPRVLAQARVYDQTKTATGGYPRFEEMERMVRRNGGSGLPKKFRPEMWTDLQSALSVALRERRYRRAAQLAAVKSRYGTRAALGRMKRAIMRRPHYE